MKIRVLAKSGIDMNAKIGSYAYTLEAPTGETKSNVQMFKKPVVTMAHADCAAFVNALDILSKLKVADEVDELEIVTDSGVAGALIEVYKFQKHCEELARYWREQIRPRFPKLEKVMITKVERKPLAGDRNSFNLIQLGVIADGQLGKVKELIK